MSRCYWTGFIGAVASRLSRGSQVVSGTRLYFPSFALSRRFCLRGAMRIVCFDIPWLQPDFARSTSIRRRTCARGKRLLSLCWSAPRTRSQSWNNTFISSFLELLGFTVGPRGNEDKIIARFHKLRSSLHTYKGHDSCQFSWDWKSGCPPTVQPDYPWLNLAAFWQQMLPTMPVLPVYSTYKLYTVNNLRFDSYHGMEEVIGSIPIRSTNHFNNLDNADALG